MIQTQTAEIYAKALLKQQHISLEEAQQCQALLREHTVLFDSLCSPAISKREKHKLIFRVFDGTIAHFLDVLSKRDRMPEVFAILEAFETLYWEKEGVGSAVLYYVQMPEEAQLDAIRNMLCKKEGKRQMRLELREDPSLIGGIVIQCGNRRYDRSVKNSIAMLRERLIQGVRT